MKKILGLFVLFAVLSIAACTSNNSSSTGNDESAVSTADDEKAVAAAVDTLNNLIINPDKAKLEDIAADQLTYGHSGGKLQNKAEFVDDLVNGAFDFISIDISDQTIHISGNTAVVRHQFKSKATNAGAPVDLDIGNVLVWQKQNGKWKLLARQAFKVPPPAAPAPPAK